MYVSTFSVGMQAVLDTNYRNFLPHFLEEIATGTYDRVSVCGLVGRSDAHLARCQLYL